MRGDPTGRALRLLSLLQTQRFWPSAELARRLEVTERTVRRDVERLRDLDYRVDAVPGLHGGYRLAAGSHLPPLVLGDDEAVAVAVGLRSAAEAAIDGIEETSLRALTTIEALLPHRLRRRVSALHSSMTSPRHPIGEHTIDPEALSVLAAACRDHEHVRFEYRSARRTVEPHRLVTAGRRWYLAAWDRDRDDWRTFRVDRLRDPRPVGTHFSPRDLPGGDAATLLSPPAEVEATLTIHAEPAEVEAVLRWVAHTVVASDATQSVVRIRSEDLGRLTMAVARIAIAAPVTVEDSPELADAVQQLTHHLAGRSLRV